MVSHVWRFMNELFTTPSQGIYDTDDTAYFMLALTMDAFRVWKFAESETAGDFSGDWPSQVMDGQWNGNISSVPFITNPWADVRDMMNDLLDWAFGAIDGYVTDTGASPKMADYFRVAETHNDAYGGSHSIGDPMIVPVSTWYQTRHRNTGIFEGAYLDPQLQIFCASGLYWGALLNKGIDNARGNKYIRWGDEILNGVVEVSDPFTQKEKNQNMIYIFDALDNRNAYTGRND
jgi:hypothetical protein